MYSVVDELNLPAMSNLGKKKPITLSVNGKRLLNIYGDKDEVKSFFRSFRRKHDGRTLPSLADEDGGEYDETTRQYDNVLHAADSYEEKLGSKFRTLQESLANSTANRTSTNVNTNAAMGEDSIPSIDSYDAGLGRKFRDLQKLLSGGDNSPQAPPSPTSVTADIFSEGVAPEQQIEKSSVPTKEVLDTIMLDAEDCDETVVPVAISESANSRVMGTEGIVIDDDVNMEPNIETVQRDDRVSIGYCEPPSPREDEGGIFDLSSFSQGAAAVFDFSLKVDDTLVETFTLGSKAMYEFYEEILARFSFPDVGQLLGDASEQLWSGCQALGNDMVGLAGGQSEMPKEELPMNGDSGECAEHNVGEWNSVGTAKNQLISSDSSTTVTTAG